jgi:hypothetical protein
MILLAIYMKTTIKLTMALVLAAVALMSVMSISVPVQEASAQDSADTTTGLEQKQKQNCSGWATCTETGTQAFTVSR